MSRTPQELRAMSEAYRDAMKHMLKEGNDAYDYIWHMAKECDTLMDERAQEERDYERESKRQTWDLGRGMDYQDIIDREA